MTIFTIGYGDLDSPAALKTIVQHLDATLIDVRSSPRSRIAGFGGRQLADLLGDAYRHRPDLGGRCTITPTALASLRPFYRSTRRHAVLMCLEAHPAHCHRHHDITARVYPRAMHLIDGGRHAVSSVAVARYLRGGYLPRREVRPIEEVAP